MKFRILTSAGGEVIFAGHSRANYPVNYGAAPETGLWRISISQFQDFMAEELKELSFGVSVEEFLFGFEIAELREWGQWFIATREYTSYRPKSKQFVSVGQLEWKDVKELSAEEQLLQLGAALVTSIDRVGTLKRKPRDFDYAGFAAAVRAALARCNATMFVA